MNGHERGEQATFVRGDARSGSVARPQGVTSHSNDGAEQSTQDLYRDDGGES
jgi:hypothetical protein